MDYTELTLAHCPVEVAERMQNANLSSSRPVTVFQKATAMQVSDECIIPLFAYFAPQVNTDSNGEFQRGFFYAAAEKAAAFPPDIKAMLLATMERTTPIPRTSEAYYAAAWAHQFDLRAVMAKRNPAVWAANTPMLSNMAFFERIYLLQLNADNAVEALRAGLAATSAHDVTILKAHLRHLVEKVKHPQVSALLRDYQDDPRRPAGVLKPGAPLGEWVREQL